MADEAKNTEAAGAVPADKGQVSDSPTEKEGSEAKSESSPDEVVKDKEGKPLPYDQQPKWKKARAAEKKLDSLLKANDLEDPDDLLDLVQRGKMVKGKLADLNQLDEIIAKANKLNQYETYWASEAEKRRRETEDPETRAERAERERDDLKSEKQRQAFDRQQAENAKAAIDGYDSEVKSLIKEMEMPKDQQGFILEFMGVGNPANDIDITDKKAIKRLVAEAAKKKDSYDQAVIAGYLKGKGQIPKVGSAQTGAPELDKPKIMLRDGSAKRAFLERMRSVGG